MTHRALRFSALTYTSMTSLLTHTVAHSTRPSFWPKTKNQPLKKCLKSCRQLSKSCQKLQNSDFQSQFSTSKINQIFLKKIFIEKYHFRGKLFVIDNFIKPLYFLKRHPIFDNFHSTVWKT